MKTTIESQALDLTFLILEGRQPKFIIGVSDAADLTTKVRKLIAERLLQEGKNLITLSVANLLPSELLSSVVEHTKSDQTDGIELTDIDQLSESRCTGLFAQLNFNRDALSRLKTPIVIWLTRSRLVQLAAV